MAAPLTNTYQTYDARGLKEDVSDIITNISPEDTPYMSNIGRGKARNTFHEWLQDSLAAAADDNAQVEGFEADNDAPTPAVRIGNYCQIGAKVVSVSGSLEAADKYGRSSEEAYQKAKVSAELKRDIESSLLANNAAVAGTSTTARVTAGLPAFLKTNTVFESAGSDPVYTNIPTDARNDGTQDAFAEADIKEAMREAWAEGGKPTMLLVGSFNKQAASTFDGVATKTFYQSAVAATKIIGAADVYVSDFGTLTIVPSRFQRGRDAFLIDPEYASVDYFRPFEMEKLAKSGDAERWLLTVEYCHKVHQEAAHAGIYDLTTS